MCRQEGGWQNTWKSLLYCPLASSEWQQKSLLAVLLSDVIFPVGWDYWPENGKSEAPEDIPIDWLLHCVRPASPLVVPGTADG